MRLWLFYVICIINILLDHFQSNKPPMSRSSSGSSGLTSTCWTACGAYWTAFCRAWVVEPDDLIYSKMTPEARPMAAKFLNAPWTMCGTETSLTQPEINFELYRLRGRWQRYFGCSWQRWRQCHSNSWILVICWGCFHCHNRQQLPFYNYLN